MALLTYRGIVYYVRRDQNGWYYHIPYCAGERKGSYTHRILAVSDAKNFIDDWFDS